CLPEQRWSSLAMAAITNGLSSRRGISDTSRMRSFNSMKTWKRQTRLRRRQFLHSTAQESIIQPIQLLSTIFTREPAPISSKERAEPLGSQYMTLDTRIALSCCLAEP